MHAYTYVQGPRNSFYGGFPREQPGEWHHDMSDTLRRIADLAQGGEVQISAHGYDEMATPPCRNENGGRAVREPQESTR